MDEFIGDYEMSTKLERLLASIAPEITLKLTYDRANEAMNSFPFHEVLINTFDKFRYFLICLHRHTEAQILHIDSMPQDTVDFHWSRCYSILKQIYGTNGEKAAFDMIRTNKDGGLREVVNKFAQTVAINYAMNEIGAKITFYINSLSATERLAAGAEYIEKYGHLLPEEMTEASAARIHDNFASILEKHVLMMYALTKAESKF
ncbi:MAG: hypothetical protein JXA96_13225 [Sedimentisphaerales bacterium]|nr:hypothetical protein [Sedimentisphaerales bacterium]